MFEATLRYNSNSDKHPIETSLTYLDSLIIPGKMLAANSKALPSNLKNYQDKADIGYYIEPTLSDFRVGSNFRDEEGRIRSWHSQYLDQINSHTVDLLAKQENLDPKQLSKQEVSKITRSAVSFQEQFVPTRLREETNKYETISDPQQYQPNAVIPWYNKIRDSDDFEVAEAIISEASEAATVPVKPCLFVTKSVIRNEAYTESLIELLISNGVDQCFLWIEDLDKQSTGESMYKKVVEFVDQLAEEEISAHFYYGDYFATLLSHHGLEGTTYGTMYGEEATEQREQRGGDGVLTRYYTDQIKDFLKIPAAVDIQQRTDAMMCYCDVCQRQFDDWTNLAQMDQDEDQNIQTPMKKHHLHVRWDQIRRVESESLEETLTRISAKYQEYISEFSRSNQIADSKSLDYIPRWINAIESVSA